MPRLIWRPATLFLLALMVALGAGGCRATLERIGDRAGRCAIEPDPRLEVVQPNWRGYFGCPVLAGERAALVWTPFEQGTMILDEQLGQLYLLVDRGDFRGGELSAWPVDPLPATVTPDEVDPPEGFYRPGPPFNALWQGEPGVRERLGWATTPAAGYQGLRQRFLHNDTLIYSSANGDVNALVPALGRWARLPSGDLPLASGGPLSSRRAAAGLATGVLFLAGGLGLANRRRPWRGRDTDPFSGLNRQGWLSLVLAVPLAVNPYSLHMFEPDKAALLRGLTVVLLVSWFASRRPAAGRGLDRLDYLACLLLLLLGLATAASLDPGRSLWGDVRWGQGWLTWLAYLALFFLARRTLWKAGERQALVDALLLASLIICLYALIQRAGLDPLYLNQPWERVRGTLPHANALGGFLAMIIPFTLYRWLTDKNGRRWLWAGLAAIQLACLALTASRSSLLAALVGGWLLLILWSRANGRPKLLKPLLAAAMLGSLLLLGLSLAPPPPGDAPVAWRALTSLFRTSGPTVQIRFLVWQALSDALRQKPWLGYGLETLDLALPPFVPPELALYGNLGAVFGRPHNEWLDVALSAGAPAAVVYTILLIGGAWAGRRAYRERRPLAIPLLAALLAGLIHHLLDVTTVTTGMLFWLFLGLVAARSRPEPGRRSLAAPSMPVVLSLLALGFAAVLFGAIRPVWADIAGRDGVALAAVGYSQAAEGTLARADRLDPRLFAYARQRAEIVLARGDQALTAGELDLAADRLGLALEHTPTDLGLWRALLAVVQRRATLFDGNSWPRVYAQCDRMLAINRRDPDLHMLCGDVRLAAREPEAALVYYQAAADLAPAYAQPAFNLATVWRWLGQDEVADSYAGQAEEKRRAWEERLRQR